MMKPDGYIGRHAKVPNDTMELCGHEEGDIWLQPIAEILEYWVSIEGNYTCMTWDDVLERKRGDYHYDEVVASLKEHGFTKPVACAWHRDSHPHAPTYGDGNHRLAAAIECGFTHIPIMLWTSYMGPEDMVFYDGYNDGPSEWGSWKPEELYA